MVEVKNTDLNIGDIVDCTVEQIMPYGAFVRIIKTGRKGMIHISELSYNFVKDINEFLHVQDNIQAKIIKIDEKGRIDLSIKQTSEPPQTQARPQRANNNNREGSREFTHRAPNQSQNNNNNHNHNNQRMNFRPPRESREVISEPVLTISNISSSSIPEETDSFEKKMASFLKTSEAKITDLNSRNSSRSGRSRRSNNNRQDKRDY